MNALQPPSEGSLPFTASIHHDGSSRYVRIPYAGELRLGDYVEIRLRATPQAPIERILLRSSPDGEQQFVEMQKGFDGPACTWWTAHLSVSMPLVNYRFLLFTRDGVWWYNGRGLQRHNPTDAEDFRLLAGYAAPGWVRNSVFYQIFPDRFADGDSAIDVRDGEFEYRGFKSTHRHWGEPPSTDSGANLVEFYGGDLPGIESRLNYLADLGVNALYLNPIFTAFSNHRYDVVDYYNVDPHLGGNQAVASLRQAANRLGLRMILDIVPNHCGVMHPWFQEALKDPLAPTADYFTFFKHPQDYACWLGVRSLPKLNYRSEALREVMYQGKDSIFRHWMRPPYSIDGWRLDVANMLARQGADQLGLDVGRGIRRAVKEENPQAYLLGENFFDSSAQLQGDCWDAVMNYSGFSKPLWYWLSGFYVRQHGQPPSVASPLPWSTQALVDSWEAYRAAIPWEIARQQFNLLGSHDTERILTVVNGSLPMARLAAGILLTYVGVPSIYYGDEVGLGRGGTGSPRECMPWEQEFQDGDLRAFYQRLIYLCRTSPALIEGGFQVLLVEQDTLAYLRDTEEEQVILVGQRGNQTRGKGSIPVAHGAIADGTAFIELFSGSRATVIQGRLPLPAISPGAQVWVSAR